MRCVSPGPQIRLAAANRFGRVAVRREHSLLRTGFRMRLVRAALPPSNQNRQGESFVDITLIYPREHNTGTACGMKRAAPRLSGSGQQHLGAGTIDAFIHISIETNAWLSCRVEHAFNSAAGGGKSGAIAQIALDNLNSFCCQVRVRFTAEAADLVTARAKCFDDVAAKKTAATGDECMHFGGRGGVRVQEAGKGGNGALRGPRGELFAIDLRVVANIDGQRQIQEKSVYPTRGRVLFCQQRQFVIRTR